MFLANKVSDSSSEPGTTQSNPGQVYFGGETRPRTTRGTTACEMPGAADVNRPRSVHHGYKPRARARHDERGRPHGYVLVLRHLPDGREPIAHDACQARVDVFLAPENA